MFCSNCASEMSDKAVVCVKCGVPVAGKFVASGSSGKSRTAYVVLGIFLGTLGIHNFYSGYSGKGIAQLLITILTGWLIVPLLGVWIWNLVEICTVSVDAQGNAFS